MPGVFVSQCNLDQGSVTVGKMRRYNLYNIFITNLNNERLPALTSRMSSRVRTLPTILWPLEVELQNKFETKDYDDSSAVTNKLSCFFL